MAVRILHCKRCGHSWANYNGREPKYCASQKCHSPYWNRERKHRREAYA